MSESGTTYAQHHFMPTSEKEGYDHDGEWPTKLEVFGPKVNRPTTLPTPPHDRSISLDSGIALQEPPGELTPPPDDENDDELLKEVVTQCCCSSDDVEDMYDCTPLQEAMVAQTMKDPGAYTIAHKFYLSPDVDPHKLQSAWNQTAQANPTLRTRMVTTPQRGCLQVVLRGPVQWQEHCDDEAVPDETTVIVWRIGAPLAAFSFNTSRHILQIKIHHSICDRWSIDLLLKQTEAAYRGEELTPRSFRPLVEYIKATKLQSNAFWEAEFQNLHGSSIGVFPRVPTAGYSPTPSYRLERSWDMIDNPNSPGTVNTKLQLSWAILQSVYTGCNDVLFGVVNTGRGVPVGGIQEIAGPTLASVPVRVQLDLDRTVGDAVSSIQTNWGASMPFEHVGLQNLLHLSPGTKAACQFQTLISVEPRDSHEGPSLFSQGQSVQTTFDLFALILRCRPTSQGLWIEMSFDPEVMDVRQGERVLSQLAHVYSQVDQYPTRPLSQITCISPENNMELSRMVSAGLSSDTPWCVHELFRRRVTEKPQAPAIASWDGDLSFHDLDHISRAFAMSLTRHVRPGQFVSLCLGKSKWVAIAMLAVMKAGGAFFLLDTIHPTPRLQQMCQTAKSNLIVTSREQLNTASQLGIPNIITVEETQLDEDVVSLSSLSPAATPEDPMYATFTSGSTGVPKCVVVHHGGFASSALAHGGSFRFTPTSRVLQFASPAFDACILEHLSTLIMGGCVCIPSADECHSNLAQSIRKYGVTVTCLTPTVTRIMNPEALASLGVMIFIGEAVLARDVERWKPHVQVVNGYGPAECSPIFSVQPELKCHDPSNIGFPTGGVGWVVHPDDTSRLMPPGCTGELLIEGSIVGRGYLSDPDQTAKVFIESPQWRHQFQPLPTGLFYKTGDLVEYTGDGSFRYNGRKDTQAKIHGQRMELGEIEHHLRNVFGTEHVVAELVHSSPEDTSADHRPGVFLAAFVHYPSANSSDGEKGQHMILPPSEGFRAACANAEPQLSDALPQFMVPDVFLPVSHLPLTVSGKTDRRFLRDQTCSLSWSTMQKYRETDTGPTLPSTAQEDSLRNIWAETLNRPMAEIGIDDSFFRLGGDSVSAMQMAASCQAAGFNVVVADIFRRPTIKKLSERIQETSGFSPLAIGLESTQTEAWFELSPIQQFFFDTVPDGHDKFTMDFLLRISRPVAEDQVEEAIMSLSGRHSMLRARFEKGENGYWGQVIGDRLEKGVCFRSHSFHSIHELETLKAILVSHREVLDPRGGTVMVVGLLDTQEGQFLSLIAHHIIIDLVSWRVLLQDLEDILTSGRPLQPASMSFQQWCKLQRAHIMDGMSSPAEPWAVSPVPMDYWGSSAIYRQNNWAQATRKPITIGREATQAILGTANDPFHTRPVELIQTAILYSFVQVFDDRQAPTIFTEGHGREPWDARIDIARTVGWFTTIAPLFLDVNKDHDIFRLLELTKYGRRRNPSNGFASFASRYLHAEDRQVKQDNMLMEILFNYTGLFQQLERPGALLQLAPITRNGLLPMPGDLPRFALIDVNAVVMDGNLSISFIYNHNTKHQNRIQEWAEKCRETLEELPNMLQQEQRLTVSDLPLLSFTEDSQLRDLLHNVSSRFDVPRSKAYWSHLRWSVPAAHGKDAPVNLEQVKAAWQQVVDRNSILRTVIIENTAHPREPVQVVLKSTTASILEEELTVAEDGDKPGLPNRFHLYHPLPTESGCPPHLLRITPRPDGSVLCQLTIHHILVDGATEQIFLADFDRAYCGVMDEVPAGKMGSYLEYLAGLDLEQSKVHWKSYLRDLTPCIFPSLDVPMQTAPKKTPQLLPFNFEIAQELYSFCRQNDMTVSSFLQVAWGLVLRAYTGSESVCFGYLHSCRDLPIAHVGQIAGPMVNILSAFGRAVEPEGGVDATEYDLTVNVAMGQNNIRGDLTYWSHLYSHSQVKMIADAFHCSILQLLRRSDTSIDSLKFAGHDNMDLILQSNVSLPDSIQSCIHTQIKLSSFHYSEATVVSAWDGDFTYRELKRRANAAAQALSQHLIGPETFVPILSEKSKWEVVSILAVLEAGGAFILLDPAQPQHRLQSMIHDDFDCPVIVSSKQQAQLAATIAPNVIVPESVEANVGFVDEVSGNNMAPVSMHSACYAVFSSGSTGKPKASVIEHRSFLSAALHHGKALDLNARSRVLHFASNAFDAAILEILSTLLVGGCVCIPSDDERNNHLKDCISKYQVNWALLTPSVSRILDPQQVVTLQTLVFGGERMSVDDIRRWSPHVVCMNAYGPSEASVVSTCQSSSQRLLEDPSNIGHPTGAVAWVLSLHPPHHPVPVGAIGELAIEGPIVGRGYANRPENMKEAFLPYPDWMHEIRDTASGLLYKTGDLVRMMPDGSISYLGRADNQVKLHGQRIELSEVEYQVQRCYPAANPEVFADLVLHGTSTSPFIVASVVLHSQTDEASFQRAADEIKTRLRSEIPSFLVPSFIFPVEKVPRLVNGKFDRRKLQEAASRKVEAEISQSVASRPKRSSGPLNPTERVLQRLWADILSRSWDSIFPEDDFFSVGGDSVAAMKLSSAASSEDLNISVSDVFLHSTLKDLAQVAVSRQPPVSSPTNITPHVDATKFSLLPETDVEGILAQAASQCSVPRDQIEDIYPCTELQVGLAALTAQRQGAFVAGHRFRLGPNTDLAKLTRAWQTVMATNDILRTRLVVLDAGYFQALLKEDEPVWITKADRTSRKLQWEFIFGQPLAQFEILPSENNQFDLMITMHHAIYDAWSVCLLVEKARLVYHDQHTPNTIATPFRNFIAYSMSRKEAGLKYWCKQLHDLKADPFPSLPSPSYRPRPSTRIERIIDTGSLMHPWVSRTAAIRLSWALVQSQYQNNDDVVFGVVSSGRTAPVHGIEAMVGPTIATYPLRVRIDKSLSGSQAIANIHEQSTESASFEQVGLSKIAAIGADGARACAFQVLLVEQLDPKAGTQDFEGGMQALGSSSDNGLYAYAVQLVVLMKADKISVETCFDPDVISEWQMNRLLDQFSHILPQVHRSLHRSVQDIVSINQHDLRQLRSWQPEIFDPGTGTVVESISQQCITQPSALAVSGSMGGLSYRELDLWSNSVADILVGKGVGSGCIVPIYLDRSHWVPVAVLGVLKTGAAFALLDVPLPLERLRMMCEEIRAPLILSSSTLEEMASMLAPKVIALSLEGTLPSLGQRYKIAAGPSRPLYVSFTSGSTGAPKGVVVNNNAFLATVMGYTRTAGLSPQSRVLHFASYAFDASILEILPTLMTGGCLCILSGSERRCQLTEAIADLRPDMAILTPSVLRTLDPVTVDSLHTVFAGGEPLKPSDIQQWAPHVNFSNAYGPVEAAVAFTIKSCIRDSSEENNIGFPLAGAVHVVDPRDPERLVPIGSVGELLLQGPQVSRGYLNNPEATNAAFIAPPSWLKEVQSPESSDCDTPLYCTGDLVRYAQDGSLLFIGRKDNQSKLRGQRLELGEVEEQVKQSISGVKDVVAEVITPSSTSSAPWLAAFITWNEPDPESSSAIIPSLDVDIPQRFADIVGTALHRLENVLPSYMVPSLIVPLRRMLETPSGKVDRRSLRESIAAIPRHELNQHLGPDNMIKRAPSMEAELLLWDIWTRVLHVGTEQIGIDDSFIRLGGDSISAVRATSEARSLGIKHSVAELLQWKTISEVAKRSTRLSRSAYSYRTPAPFSLVSDSEKKRIMSLSLAGTRPFTPDNVEDIIPAVTLQAFYITNSSPVSMARRFETHLDIGRLRKACEHLMARHSILRTVFVSHNDCFFQVVLKEVKPSIGFVECADPEKWVQAKSKEPSPATTAQGSVPLSFTLVTNFTRQYCIFIIHISHAQYDGVSVPLLWEDLVAAYQDRKLRESGQFKDVVSYRMSSENSCFSFWRDHLNGASASAIDPLGVAGISEPSVEDITVEHTICRPQTLPDITLATLVKAASAWVLGRHAGSSDIILGQIMHGRGGSLPNIGRTLGPCLTQLPVRVTLQPDMTVEDLLHEMQTRQMEAVANDNISFDHIRRHCTSWPDDSAIGCFTHHQGLQMVELPAVQDFDGIKSSPSLTWVTSKLAPGQVGINSVERSSHLELLITATENTLDQASAEDLVKRIAAAIELFASSSGSTLASLV
ncbi:hypothetical protein P170DRAFT_464604 [Aspergillus steynii IBT 23096]|uniref:Carrier domain-containing protein n=1 Tax=Aspergillus steynii IBT 23096 TaxID=1392250 RepID=A0A2I2G860_9EURO|nr:uncharacterized protein P170DRAFT_464604 [Aspergillus steynii IBT 23096]PLB49054.1 hypothetical protein P170DRAFT_464604 [Aspergillus steynii IBT 23096]